MITLLGIVVIVVGFALRWNTLLVVVAAGLVTGLAGGMSWTQVVSELGRLFVENRYMTIPLVLLAPIVGLLEQHGLRERAAELIRRAGQASAGRVMLAYHALRAVASTVGIGIGTHASMVRPLVAPMAEAAAQAGGPPLSPREVERVRAHAAAAENLGNFFADDIIVAIGPVLLIVGFFQSAGVSVSVWEVALWGIPTAAWTAAVGWWRYRKLDTQLRTRGVAPQKQESR